MMDDDEGSSGVGKFLGGVVVGVIVCGAALVALSLTRPLPEPAATGPDPTAAESEAPGDAAAETPSAAAESAPGESAAAGPGGASVPATSAPDAEDTAEPTSPARGASAPATPDMTEPAPAASTTADDATPAAQQEMPGKASPTPAMGGTSTETPDADMGGSVTGGGEKTGNAQGIDEGSAPDRPAETSDKPTTTP